MKMKRWASALCTTALLSVVGCASEPDPNPVHDRTIALDDLGTAPVGMHLLVLRAGSDTRALAETLDATGGSLLHILPPRMVVAKVPAGARQLLSDFGVLIDFDDTADIRRVPSPTVDEQRFVRLFNSRYHAAQIKPAEMVTPKKRTLSPGEAFETDAPAVADRMRASALEDPNIEEAERAVSVAYASGRVVVAVVLPESNGRGAPNAETWTEDSIVETYQKIQAALEGIKRHEPNAKLDFVLHYTSAPQNGGLPGTVDCDYESGLEARGSQNQGKMYAQIFANLTGKQVGESDWWMTQRDYLADLKDKYQADNAFIVFVAANQNYTAGFRAFASINGPSTWLDSSYGFEVFMHEFGHIFGAWDEYCPDACISPSALQGYLGMTNANATFRMGSWGGVNLGQGEDQSSLMMGNVVNGVNGYTRGAWGWLDTDGDGLIEVRDTTPQSDLTVQVRDGRVALTGRIVDKPATSNGATPYSVNRVRALHVRFDGTGPFVRFPVAGTRRGREDVNIDLGVFPKGAHELALRAENSVGNLEATPVVLSFNTTDARANTAPRVSLQSSAVVASPASRFVLTANAKDLEGDDIRYRFDLDGDGRYDTSFGLSNTATGRASRTGRVQLSVQARDVKGAISTATTVLWVMDRNALPVVKPVAVRSPVVGADALDLTFGAASSDPEGQTVEHSYLVELDDAARSLIEETPFSTSDQGKSAHLATPVGLSASLINLLQLDSALWSAPPTFDAVRINSSVLAVSAGRLGVLFIDTANVAQPRLITRLVTQSEASSLKLSGSTLFVLGDKLSVVDVRNPNAPVEVLQRRVSVNQRVLSSQEEMPIPEEPSKGIPLFGRYAEAIEGAFFELTLDHPSPSELVVTMQVDDGETITLFDHPALRGGRNVLRINNKNSNLSRLIGLSAHSEFRVQVTDTVANKSDGRVLGMKLTFSTKHRAVELSQPANSIVGMVGSRLVLSGEGLEIFETRTPDDVRSLDTVGGGTVVAASILDRGVLVFAREGKEAHEPLVPGLDLVGLSYVDLSFPYFAVITRQDAALSPAEIGMVGSRFYFREDNGESKGGPTVIGDGRAFMAGRAYRVGTTDVPLASGAFGDDASLWLARGVLERFDVRDPARVSLLESFVRPWVGYPVVRTLANEAVMFAGTDLILIDLAKTVHTISQSYRLTAKARDAAGMLAEASRTVHVIPYDHAPRVSSVTKLSGNSSRDEWQFRVLVDDADFGSTFDSYSAIRVDFDGDGTFDGPWLGYGREAVLTHRFARGGDYVVRVQARDAFYALSEVASLNVHVESYVPVRCATSSQCPQGEYCELAASACGAEGQGVCELIDTTCGTYPQPVCGCDGKTYRTRCAAQGLGISVSYEGVCRNEQMQCGGPQALTCSVPGMQCIYPIGETEAQSCGNGGVAVGECQYPPEECYFLGPEARIPGPGWSQPVCGCDHQTYRSVCEANRAGVSVSRFGSCDTPPDCRATGCEAGSSCNYCFTGYVCMPDGASC